MSLLKRLQQKKGESRESVSDVLISNDELESNSQQVSSPTIIRRDRRRTLSVSSEAGKGSAPWLMTQCGESPGVELLVPLARDLLNDVLPSEGDQEVDLDQVVRQAVQMAAQNIRGQMRVGKTETEIAEKELLSLLRGKGPLQPLFEDHSVTDIFIDQHDSIKVIRLGQAMETPFRFRSAEEFRLFVRSMLQSVDRSLTISTPIIDCVLDDDYRCRVNAMDSSLLEGAEPRIAIRIPRLQQISFFDVLQSKTLPVTLAAWLADLVSHGGSNILVVGATGSGKTVMTTALLSAVASDERIITIEDVPEIFVPTPHLEKLVARPANAQGQGEVTMPELLRAALRRAPHRIVVGEIRDEEGRLFLRALETGHSGSIATLHADSAKDGLWRLLDLVSAYEKAPQDSIIRRISRSVNCVITMRKVDGRPCLEEVSGVIETEGGDFSLEPIVSFEGQGAKGREWKLLGAEAKLVSLLRQSGISLAPGPGLTRPSQARDMGGGE